jgi:hypothetical protein
MKNSTDEPATSLRQRMAICIGGLALVGLLIFAVPSFCGTGLTGRWSGTLTDLQDGSKHPFYMDLKAEDSRVTGGIGTDPDQTVLFRLGRIVHNKFTLRLTLPNGNVFDYVLLLDGDTLEGSLTVTNAKTVHKAKIQLHRLP